MKILYKDNENFIKITKLNDLFVIGYSECPNGHIYCNEKYITKMLNMTRHQFRTILIKHNAILEIEKTVFNESLLYYGFESKIDAEMALEELESIYILNKLTE